MLRPQDRGCAGKNLRGGGRCTGQLQPSLYFLHRSLINLAYRVQFYFNALVNHSVVDWWV
jgi:hypothetical protein